MKALVLWADDRSTNLGVRALAAGTAELIEMIEPGSSAEHQSFGFGAAPVKFGAKSAAASVFNRSCDLRNWLRGFDVIFDTRAGDSFADIYGFQRLITMSAFAELAHAERVPVIMAPQTIGPFAGKVGRAIARRAIHMARVAVARDSASFEFAQNIGAPVDLLGTDVVFALKQPTVASVRRDVLLNVSGLLWEPSPHVAWRSYRAVVRDLYLRLVSEGRSVTLLPHVLDSAGLDNDVRAVKELAESLGDCVEIVVPTSLEEARGLMAGAELVIGSRMHACLNSLSVGTPAIPMAYSRKFEPLMNDIGWQCTVDLRSSLDPVGEVLGFARASGLSDAAGEAGSRARSLVEYVASAIARALA